MSIRNIFRSFLWLNDETLMCEKEVATSPERKKGRLYLQLFLPSVYSYAKYLQPFEDLGMLYDQISGCVVVFYLVDGQRTGDEVVIARDDEAQSDVVARFPRRLRALIMRGRTRFTVRRLCEVEVSNPSLRDRHRAVTTRHAVRGKFKRGTKADKAIRLPTLLTISTVARLPNHLS